MKHPEHYGKTKLIKIGNYNISEKDDTITIPHYLTFILGKVKYDFKKCICRIANTLNV